jgi:hypothetical protein
MSKRRWIFLGGSLAGLFVVLLYWTQCQPDPDPIRYEEFSQIEDGMHRADVEQLLGCPPGNYRTGPVRRRVGEAMSGGRVPPDTWHTWKGDHGNINVGFDSRDQVVYKYYVRGDKDDWPWSMFGYFERMLGYDL